MILEELGVPYVQHIVEFSDVKKESYTKLNPNGRLPTIKDPNTGITLWEVRIQPHRISPLSQKVELMMSKDRGHHPLLNRPIR
jgi:hypothetical protein